MPAIPTPNHKRILVIKLKQPGDVLVSTPVIAALKEAWPECHLTYLVPRGTEEMVSGHPGLDGLMVVDRRGATWLQTWQLIRDLRRQRFDLVLELSGGDRGAILSLPHRGPGAPRLCPSPAALLAAPRRLHPPGASP